MLCSLMAVAMDNPNDGVSDEYWFNGEKVDTPSEASLQSLRAKSVD